MRACYALLAVLLLGAPLSAQDLGVSVRASTLGIGGDLSVGVAPTVNVRLTANAFAYGQDGLFDGADADIDGLTLDYDAELGFGSVGLLADWHPLGNTFHITAGALYNLNGVTADISAAEPYYNEDLDRTFSVERVGTLQAEITYEQPIAPYLGIGVGDLTAGPFGITLEAGAAYVGPPSIAMTGSGLIGGTADPANVAVLEAGFDSFRLHPVVSLGLKTSLGR